jgi:DNA invertase Pin-like site-specific DNA recombinase
MRVALYARYSSDQQRDASIEDQLRLCRAQAERAGWQVVEDFADHALSGATTKRPAFQRLNDAIKAGAFDLVLAESLDRFSRDLEHIAAFHKLCRFQQVRIHTVAEGEVSELHVGLKGTMAALYLKDLADKTRRGLEGRIRAGRSTGTPPYGYHVVRKLRDDGEVDRGLRAIDDGEAAIVRRIFEAYAGGSSPRRIARELNAELVPGPGGGIWYDSAIRGRPKRGDGLLRNELYVGRLVWRRRTSAKDPATGATVRRYVEDEDVIVTAVPQLRIIDDALWQRVQDRMKSEGVATPSSAAGPNTGFWDRRRPRHLLSGTVFCGACGRPCSAFGQDYLGCNAAKNGSCRNTHRVRRSKLEARVLEGLGRQLMEPSLVADFIEEFNAAWKQLAADLKAQASAHQRERAAIERKIANLIDAISDGRSSPAILTKLEELEAQRVKLAQPAVQPSLVPPALHPRLADIYAAKVRDLKVALAEGNCPEALEAARSLIDRVILHPPKDGGDPPHIELVGELMAMLKAAGVDRLQACERSAEGDPVLGLFVSSVKEAPGAEPPPCFPLPRHGQHDRRL